MISLDEILKGRIKVDQTPIDEQRSLSISLEKPDDKNNSDYIPIDQRLSFSNIPNVSLPPSIFPRPSQSVNEYRWKIGNINSNVASIIGPSLDLVKNYGGYIPGVDNFINGPLSDALSLSSKIERYISNPEELAKSAIKYGLNKLFGGPGSRPLDNNILSYKGVSVSDSTKANKLITSNRPVDNTSTRFKYTTENNNGSTEYEKNLSDLNIDFQRTSGLNSFGYDDDFTKEGRAYVTNYGKLIGLDLSSNCYWSVFVQTPSMYKAAPLPLSFNNRR